MPPSKECQPLLITIKGRASTLPTSRETDAHPNETVRDVVKLHQIEEVSDGPCASTASRSLCRKRDTASTEMRTVKSHLVQPLIDIPCHDDVKNFFAVRDRAIDHFRIVRVRKTLFNRGAHGTHDLEKMLVKPFVTRYRLSHRISFRVTRSGVL